MKLISSSESNKTPGIISVLSTLVIFAYFLFVWIYLGEFNMSKLNWLLVAQTKDKVQILLPNFHPVLLLFLLLPLLVPLIIALVIRLGVKKWVGVDIIPILVPFEVMMISIIVSGLIRNPWSTWIVLARIGIVFGSWFISFMIINKITNLLIIHSRFGEVFFSQKYNEVALNKARQQEIANAWRLSKRNKKEYLEVPPRVKKKRHKE